MVDLFNILLKKKRINTKNKSYKCTTIAKNKTKYTSRKFDKNTLRIRYRGSEILLCRSKFLTMKRKSNIILIESTAFFFFSTKIKSWKTKKKRHTKIGGLEFKKIVLFPQTVLP